jgi:hypothetical protein
MKTKIEIKDNGKEIELIFAEKNEARRSKIMKLLKDKPIQIKI